MLKTDKERLLVVETKLEAIESGIADIKKNLGEISDRLDTHYPNRIECEAQKKTVSEIKSLLDKGILAIVGSVFTALLSLVIKH